MAKTKSVEMREDPSALAAPEPPATGSSALFTGRDVRDPNAPPPPSGERRVSAAYFCALEGMKPASSAGFIAWARHNEFADRTSKEWKPLLDLFLKTPVRR